MAGFVIPDISIDIPKFPALGTAIETLADLIAQAEQNEAIIPQNFGDFLFNGVIAGILLFDAFTNQFVLVDKSSSRILRTGASTQAIRDQLTAPQGEPGPVGPAGPGPDLDAIATLVRNLVAQLLGREPTTGGGTLPRPPADLERVLPGGTVNVPVVLGSTGDPSGQRRPPPSSDQGNNIEIARKIANLIRAILASRAAARAARRIQERQAAIVALWISFLRRQGGSPMGFGQSGQFQIGNGGRDLIGDIIGSIGGIIGERFSPGVPGFGTNLPAPPTQGPGLFPVLPGGGGGACPSLFRGAAPAGMRVSPVPWFPVQAPNGKWFFFGHLGTPTFSKLKARRRHHHHGRKR